MDTLKLGIVLIVLGYIASGCGQTPATCSTFERLDVQTYGPPAQTETIPNGEIYFWNTYDFSRSYITQPNGMCDIKTPS